MYNLLNLAFLFIINVVIYVTVGNRTTICYFTPEMLFSIALKTGDIKKMLIRCFKTYQKNLHMSNFKIKRFLPYISKLKGSYLI